MRYPLILLAALTACRPSPVSEPAPVTEGFAKSADGYNLFYQKVGSGTPRVIVPGGLFLYDDLKQLGNAHSIVFYDIRNRGRSEAVPDTSRLGIARDVEDLEAIRAHFGVDRMQVIGYSYLGKMVMMYALTNPGRVERIIQLSPVPREWGQQYPPELVQRGIAAGVDTTEWKRLQEMIAAREHESRPREFCERQWSVTRFNLVGDSANVGRLGSGLCHMENEWPARLAINGRYLSASIRAARVTPSDVARITMPVLIIHGTRDRNAPYGGGRQWALELPDARLVVIPGAAHNSWADAPDIVIPAIRTFLEGRWPERGEKVTSLLPL